MLAGYGYTDVGHGAKERPGMGLAEVVLRCGPVLQLLQQHQSGMQSKNQETLACNCSEGIEVIEAEGIALSKEGTEEEYRVFERVQDLADKLADVYLVLVSDTPQMC